jgi:uncharacterized protein (TIRG00374 family)
MKDRATSSVSTTVIGTKILTQDLAFIFFLFIGIFILALDGKASNLLILITTSISFLIVFIVMVAVYIISSKARIRSSTKWLIDIVNFILSKPKQVKLGIFRRISGRKIEHRVTNVLDSEKILNRLTRFHDNYLMLKKYRHQLKAPLLFGLMANLTELATIYTMFVANGYWVNPGAIIIGYAVANFAGIISVIPGGVGLYEAIMVGVMVSAGVPAGVSISAIVMYRIINSALALPAGYYLYHKQLNKNNKLKIKQIDA